MCQCNHRTDSPQWNCEAKGTCVCAPNRHYHIAFHRSCAHWRLHRQCTRVAVSPQLCNEEHYSFFFFSQSGRWKKKSVYFCLSFIMEGEYLFIYLKAFQISLLLNGLSRNIWGWGLLGSGQGSWAGGKAGTWLLREVRVSWTSQGGELPRPLGSGNSQKYRFKPLESSTALPSPLI